MMAGCPLYCKMSPYSCCAGESAQWSNGTNRCQAQGRTVYGRQYRTDLEGTSLIAGLGLWTGLQRKTLEVSPSLEGLNVQWLIHCLIPGLLLSLSHVTEGITFRYRSKNAPDSNSLPVFLCSKLKTAKRAQSALG